MNRATTKENARLTVARHAARLFLERGVAGTSGDDIAAAAGISTRSVWRYFGTKEGCVEPLFTLSARRFVDVLTRWPRTSPIEDLLHTHLGPDKLTADDLADDVLVVRLVARLPEEPALRATWLTASYECEARLAPIIADRVGRPFGDYDVRLCAATVSAAIRIIDETISLAVLTHGQELTTPEINDRLAQAIRQAATLPFCDPVEPRIWPEKDDRHPAVARVTVLP
jgi:AcrR family transcriptional regulator